MPEKLMVKVRPETSLHELYGAVNNLVNMTIDPTSEEPTDKEWGREVSIKWNGSEYEISLKEE